MIHVYAFTPAGVRVEGIEGDGGVPVDVCTVDDVAAIVSAAQGNGSEATTDALLAHGHVVEALRDRSDAVLPVRFGERITREELRRAIAEQLPAWRTRLQHVRGCVEFGVRMLPPPVLVVATTGTDYMRLRQAAFEQTDALLSELSRRARASVVARDHAAAYLVPVEERPAFERAVADFTAAHPDLTVVCTSPWAPYSFAEAS